MEQIVAITELFPEPILLLDIPGTILGANRGAAQLLAESGLSPGRPLVECCAAAPETIQQYLRQASGTSSFIPGSITLRAANEPLEFRTECARVVASNGQPTDWLMLRLRTRRAAIERFTLLNKKIEELSAEIHRREQIELELKAAQEELQAHARELEGKVAERTAELIQSNKSLESFCYSVAHDLRAPLRGISGLTSALVEDYGSVFDEPGKRIVHRIVHATARMDSLITDLLEFGRLSHAKLDLQPVILDDLAREVIDVACEQAAEKAARINVASSLGTVCANRAALRQVLLNIVGNALKFSRPGVQPCIQVFSERSADWIRLHVADNGIGIPESDQGRAFKLFERFHPERYPGTGVGLAIVRLAVERMGGTVGLESRPGEGSIFWFSLPAA